MCGIRLGDIEIQKGEDKIYKWVIKKCKRKIYHITRTIINDKNIIEVCDVALLLLLNVTKRSSKDLLTAHILSALQHTHFTKSFSYGF